MQDFSIHHGGLEQHISLFNTLHSMLYCLHADASDFSAKNWVYIFKLRGVVQNFTATLHWLTLDPIYLLFNTLMQPFMVI